MESAIPDLLVTVDTNPAERDCELLLGLFGGSGPASVLLYERLAELGEDADKVFEFETEVVAAPGALQNILHFQLRKPLRDLAAAVRAGEYGGLAVQGGFHG